MAQKHLNHFLRFCYNAAWIDRIPKLSPIKIDAPDTEPLTDEEYNKIVGAATGRTGTLIKLMRWSGLAIRDASTLQRSDLNFDKSKDLYRIIRKRTRPGRRSTFPSPRTYRKSCLRSSTAAPLMCWNSKRRTLPSTGTRAGWARKSRRSLKRRA